MSSQVTLANTFERIEIINLPHRVDRRRAVTAELLSLGIKIDGRKASLLPAVRPVEPDGFETIGARGCFLSHLDALERAANDKLASVLVLEDDVAFSARERKQLETALAALAKTRWDIFYGGSPVEADGDPLTKVAPDTPVQLAHFIAFSREAVQIAVPYLKGLLGRPAGSPDGGPMHVDGAYGWLRRAHPELIAYAATPPIAHQRSSATDIHERRGIDKIPVLRATLVPARALKNCLTFFRS